jgi:hypothetical protein
MEVSFIIIIISIIITLILHAVVIYVIYLQQLTFKNQVNTQIKNAITQFNNKTGIMYDQQIQDNTVLNKLQNDLLIIKQETQNQNSTLTYEQKDELSRLNTMNQQVNQWRSDVSKQLANLQ